MQDTVFCQFEIQILPGVVFIKGSVFAFFHKIFFGHLIIIFLTNSDGVIDYEQMTKKERPMPRPKRPRYIGVPPLVTEFWPQGGQETGEVILSFEEFEAVRLIDYDGLDQGEAAETMNVSRQTVGRILRAGRFKLSKTIVESCRLKLSGGCYKIDENRSGRGRRRRHRGGGCRGPAHGRYNP